ncbi:MAG: diphthine synthase [Candidatus Bathyarchaeota archaeon]|nr:diphthine synthase [Candidatus Bathyarchaeota archaeon]
MGELVLIGLGLYDENDISLRGLNEAKSADTVFAEFHTSLMAGLSIERLENLAGKKITVISRRWFEEEDCKQLLKAAVERKVALFVPGDPLIATTHVDLRIRAEKAGIRTKVVHGSSIVSAVMGLSGLQNYKFGRSVTIPFAYTNSLSETPYNVIKMNLGIGLHTLCFLDLEAGEKRYMTIKEGLETLRILEKKRNERIVTNKMLAVGIAGAGSDNPIIKAGMLRELLDYDFHTLPHTLIFPGKLHFVEIEALIELANAPESIRRMEK